MASGPTTMSLQLVDTPTGAWSLELADGTTTRRHARGEPVVYPGRTLRRAQAWERWPVVGVRVADARAYAAWLDHTGRVPGARLCTNAEWERAARGAVIGKAHRLGLKARPSPVKPNEADLKARAAKKPKAPAAAPTPAPVKEAKPAKPVKVAGAGDDDGLDRVDLVADRDGCV